jgi:hypothetical protein
VSWDDAEDMPAMFEALRLKASTTLHGGCSKQCSQCGGVGCLLGISRTTLTVWKRHVGQCLVFLPLFNCRQESPARFPTGCAYVLPADAAPLRSFFPFGLDYYTGISMVELESRIDDKGMVLTPDYFLTEDMRLRRDTFVALAYGETDPDALPGVVLHDTLKDLQPFTSSRYPKDPLLRTFRADFSPSEMRMGAKDWAFIGTSTWADASNSTKEVAGHSGNQQHFSGFLIPFAVYFLSFGYISARNFYREGAYYNQTYTEKSYILLSLSTKLALFWLVTSTYLSVMQDSGVMPKSKLLGSNLDLNAVRVVATVLPPSLTVFLLTVEAWFYLPQPPQKTTPPGFFKAIQMGAPSRARRRRDLNQIEL